MANLEAIRARSLKSCTTSVYEAHGVAPEVQRVYRQLHDGGELTVPAHPVLSPTWPTADEGVEAIERWLPFASGRRGTGDDWLRFGGVFLGLGQPSDVTRILFEGLPYTAWGGFVEQEFLLNGQNPTHGTFIATKLLRFFSHPDPAPEEVAQLAEVLEATGGDICADLLVMFLSPSFLDERHERALVKSPVEVLVGGLRGTGIRETPLWVHGSLERMGQILFRPPSVKGWPDGTAWLTSAAAVERMKAASRLAQARPEAGE